MWRFVTAHTRPQTLKLTGPRLPPGQMSNHASSSSSGPAGHRRTWDKSEYEAKARERLNKEKEEWEAKKAGIKPKPTGPKVKREMLKPREFKVSEYKGSD